MLTGGSAGNVVIPDAGCAGSSYGITILLAMSTPEAASSTRCPLKW